ESVRSKPFYLNYGYHPRLAELLDLPQKVPRAHEFMKGMKQAVEQARQCLARAQKRMKSYQDNNRREALYLPGDMVLLSTQNMRELLARYLAEHNLGAEADEAADGEA
ncbi:lysM domain-containing protein, partial [Haematococcus lacustris]